MQPRNNPKKQTYSTRTLLLGAGLLTLTSVNLILLYSGFCETEENGAVNRNDASALAKTLICPLFALGAMMSAKTTSSPVENDVCIGSTDGPKHRPYNGYLYLARNIEDVLDATNGGDDDVLQRFSELKNTIFHFQVMNHYYDRLKNIYEHLSADDRAALCASQDINGRTPFFLSLAISAPGEVQRLLATKANVLMPDKKGMTPLKLASMGLTNLKTTQYLLSLIDEQDLRQASLEDYPSVSRKKIIKHLKDYEISPNKASNHCTDAFNSGNMPICLPKENAHKHSDVFYMDEVTMGEQKIHCVIATKDNIEKIARVKTDHKAFAGNYEEAHRLYPDVSDQSITDVVVARQAENIAVIHQAINQAKSNYKPSKKYS